MTHFDGLKMLDPYHVLLAGNTDPISESGPAFVYDWRGGALTRLGLPVSVDGTAHDIQWLPPGTGGRTDGGLYRPTGKGFVLFDTTSGLELESYGSPDFHDVNHAQVLLDGSGTAVVSSRYSSSFHKYDMAVGANIWTVGGAAGTLALVDIDGALHPPGSSLFYGQHNAEYFGEGEYMLFDNHFNYSSLDFVDGARSRLVIYEVDEQEQLAREVWELELADRTPIYGDNDRLPTGNLLASSWPVVIDAADAFQCGARARARAALSPARTSRARARRLASSLRDRLPDRDATPPPPPPSFARPRAPLARSPPLSARRYDARVFEVVRATKQTAWELFVVGRRCTAPADGSRGCVRTETGGTPTGWSMYSVERFYEAPLVAAVSCAPADGGAPHLNFTAFNNFKSNGEHTGTYKVFGEGQSTEGGDTPLLENDFYFTRHWRETHVSIDVSSAMGESNSLVGSVAVLNQWGDRTLKHFSC